MALLSAKITATVPSKAVPTGQPGVVAVSTVPMVTVATIRLTV